MSTLHEEENFLNEMKKATAMRGSELKSNFKTMLFSYRNALSMLSGLKNELDEVVNHIDNLDIVTISDFYKPVLEKANDLVNKIEVLDDDIKNHSDMKAYISSIKSHNIDTWVRKLDEVKYQIIKAKDAEDALPFVTFNGLMWEKETQKMIWHDAMAYAENLRLGGYDNWRLPTKSELLSVIYSCGGTPNDRTSLYYSSEKDYNLVEENINNCSYQNSLNNKGFKTDRYSYFWSSSQVSSIFIKEIWVVNFHEARFDFLDRKLHSCFVRCVRYIE